MLPDVEVVQGKSARYLCFKGSDLISNTIRQNGAWEEIESGLAVLMTHDVDGGVVVDVGANLGAFAIPVAQKLVTSNGAVHAFEPQRTIFHQLCGNIFLNGLENVYAYNVALGAAVGSVQLPKIDYAKTDNVGAVSLLPEVQQATRVAYSSSEFDSVDVWALNSCARIDRCDFLKLDVEGFESEVISGAADFLEDNDFPPVLFEEWRPGKFAGATNEAVMFRQAKTRNLLGMLGYDFLKFGNSVLAQSAVSRARVSITTKDGGRLALMRER